MKRKRNKHKKGKGKGASKAVAVAMKVENDSGLDESAVMEIDTPSSTGTDQPLNGEDPDGSIAKGVVGKPLTRVTVKLKTPKVIESQLTSSDTDKSSHQMGLEKQGVLAAEKPEDSANSLPEAQVSPLLIGNLTKKSGTIKIKSSKVLASNNGSTDVLQKRDGSPAQKTPPLQGPRRHGRQELEIALMVIKKVMKMDAAEPFNVPVNPVALGIPDYFDVIDTPMDFGTICRNLESGGKYANSEDVYKDIQYIWDNCFKYNSKGDYILDLMKRVKKNFAKLWTTAGLYSEQTIGSVDSSQEKVGPTGQIKVYVKGGLSKKTSKKGQGRRHKSDCLCAICVLKRRRREREENERIALGLTAEASQEESPSGDNTASDMDESALNPNADSGEKMEESKQPGQSLEDDNDEDNGDEEEEEEEDNDVEMKEIDNIDATERANKQSWQELADKSGDGIRSNRQRVDTVSLLEEETEAVQLQKQKELKEKPPKVKASQVKLYENPMLLSLCGTLFPDNSKNSIWSGPRSLVRRRPATYRTSPTPIHTAIDMLMKQAN